MDKLEEFQKASVKKIKQFIAYAKVNWKGLTIVGLGAIFVILLTVVIIPNTRASIRTKEVNALIQDDFKDVPQVKFIEYGQLESTIRKEDQLAVALVDINDENYPSFKEALNDKEKMSQFEGTIYVYPMVYDLKETKEFYQLKTGISLLYFEHQKAIERTDLDVQKEINLYLVDHLNSLTKGRLLKVPSEVKANQAPTSSTTETSTSSQTNETSKSSATEKTTETTETTKSSTSTESSSSKDEDVIDELQQ